MKKFFLIALLLTYAYAMAQTPVTYLPKPDPSTRLLTSAYPPSSTIPQWYKNLEKYWYYRYRLVNDFMLIGPGEGMSIPAQKRNLYDRNAPNLWPNATAINELEWQDATIDLGHYIATLATEYKMLNDNHWDVTRTLSELQYAQAALYRLSNNAATYESLIPSYNSGYPSIAINTTTANYTSLSSGFFLRDDVPFATFIDQQYNAAANKINWKHFNRLGLNPTQSTTALRAANSAFGAFTGHFYGPNPNPYGITPLMASSGFNTPNSESQDQLGEIFVGEALMKKYLTGDPLGLQTSAQQAISKFLHYPRTYKGVPTSGAYYSSLPKIPALQPYWSIPDPLDNTYCAKHDCSSTGFMYPFAVGLADAEFSLGGKTSTALADQAYLDGSIHSLNFLSYALTFEATQLYKIPACGNNGNTWPIYVDPYVAFESDYVMFQPPPLLSHVASPLWVAAFLTDQLFYSARHAYPFPGSPVNTSFPALVIHAIGDKYGTPQYPLLWELNYYNEPIWAPFNPDFGHTYISSLLDDAPPCGPYDYEQATLSHGASQPLWQFNGGRGDYSNSSGHAYGSGEWSCADRLAEAYKRRFNVSSGCSTDLGDDAEYNGLDYTMLFNLYALERGGTSGYLGGMMNPYYCTNYEVNYPDVNNYGSITYKLQLNWLEYLSMNDHIVAPNGWVSFRAAKVIDLLPADPTTGKPGFLADYGSFFQAAVRDYSCAGDTLGDGVYNFATLSPTSPYYIRMLPGGTSDTVKVIPNKEIPIVYLPKGPGFIADKIPDDPNPDQKLRVDSMFTDENREKTLEEYKYAIYNNLINSPELLSMIQQMYGWQDDTVSKYVTPEIYDPASVNLYPNPAHGISNLTYHISSAQEIRIVLTNTLGQDLSSFIHSYDHNPQEGDYKVDIDATRLTPGIYYCSISIGGQIITKKLVVEQ